MKHPDDLQLQVLVFGDDESDEYRVTTAHVESCGSCQSRLSELAGSADDEHEIQELLSGYPQEPWQEGCVPSPERAPPHREKLEFLSPPSHPEMLGRLGRYEIERVIGSGGMGIVLKGFDTELNRPVAIKVLARHLAHSGAARQRFGRESKAAAAVVHEHVVAIHNVESDGEVPFLVMQYVAGESLQSRVEREGPLDAKGVLRIGIQAAAGLAAAHEQGVIHRDVKPANILLETGVERVLLTDFGLARTVDDASLTHTGIVAGTPHYMSPEQANGDATDHRTDLFSLGSVLYFAATGRPPFRAERAMGVLHRICQARHRPAWEVNAEVPDELAAVIDRLLEKNTARRFATAAEVKEALSRVLIQLQQRGGRRPNQVKRFLFRHRRRLLFGAVITTCIWACAITIVAVGRSTSSFLADDPAPPVPPPVPPASSLIHSKVTTTAETKRSAELEIESAEYLATLRDAADRLGRLEAAARGSAFARSKEMDFNQQMDAFNRRLDQIEK